MTRAKTQRIEVDMAELERIVERSRSEPLSEEEHAKLHAAIETLGYLAGEIEKKGTTIARLRKLLFGPQSEKTKDVLDPPDSDASGDASGSGDEGGGAEGPSGGDEGGSSEETGDGDVPQDEEGEPKKKRKGHGRRGADEYEGAEIA